MYIKKKEWFIGKKKNRTRHNIDFLGKNKKIKLMV